MYVCMFSVTLVHPAKAGGQNEMSFGRDTCVIPSNIVLDRGPGTPTGRRDLGVRTTVHSNVAYCLWLLFAAMN